MMRIRVEKACNLESILRSLLTLEICHLHFANIETELKILCTCPHLVQGYGRGLTRIQKCLINNTRSKQMIPEHIKQTLTGQNHDPRFVLIIFL